MFGHFARCLWDSMEPLRELKAFEGVIPKSKGSYMAEHYLNYGGTVKAGCPLQQSHG
jgi:hypothetical protein